MTKVTIQDHIVGNITFTLEISGVRAFPKAASFTNKAGVEVNGEKHLVDAILRDYREALDLAVAKRGFVLQHFAG